jgi:uncharacterized protein
MILEFSIPQQTVTSSNMVEIEKWFRKHVQSDFSANGDTQKMTNALKAIDTLNNSAKLDDIIDTALGYTIVHKAAKLGFNCYIENCADKYPSVFDQLLNKASKHGNTPLHLAALNGQVNTVESLISAGADPNIENISKLTPLFLAASKTCANDSAKNAQIAIIKMLINNTQSSKFGTVDLSGMPFLLNLAKFNNAELVRVVLERRPELILTTDKRNQNIMHHSLFNNSHDLVAHFSTNNDLVKQITEYGATALILACRYAEPEAINILLNNTSCVDPEYLSLKDGHNKTAVDYLEDNVASGIKDAQAYRFLIEKIGGNAPSTYHNPA